MHYRVLGPVAAERNGVRIPLGGPQQRRLLGVLLSRRAQVVPVSTLVEALWADGSEPRSADRSILTYVSRLRAALGDDRLETFPTGYRLAAESLDSTDFEGRLAAAETLPPDRAVTAYDEALALWDGEPYGEFAREWWALPEGARLAELRTVARESRAASLLALGRPGVVADLERLVADEPLRERPVSLLIQGLNAAGRAPEALAAFTAFRRRLVEETGLDPSRAVTDLVAQIAAGDVAAMGPGQALRGYVLHEQIGRGEFGLVYRATQPATQRPVAVKVIPPDVAGSADYIHRFETEARTIAHLEHPHVLPLYDFWREPGGAYLIFRYLSGGTARENLVAGGPWSLPRVSRLVEEVGGALLAAHAAGIVHRDVCLANILLDEHGASYLADFGIALAGGVDDPVNDLRALAECVHELVTGSARRRGSRTRPRDTGLTPLPGGPPGLDRVLRRAHDGSYQSVAEFIVSWRAATGNRDGALSDVSSDAHRTIDSARRNEALTLARGAGSNPYCGLRAFDESEARSFFGREAATTDLLAKVEHLRLVTIVGSSGSGKSSLARAGVVPALRARGTVTTVMTPGPRPSASLEAALLEVAGSAEGDLLATLSVQGLVLVVDQLEELWTRCDEEGRTAFLGRLGAMLAREPGPGGLHVLVTVRADLFDRPLSEPTLSALIGPGTYPLPALTATELDDAVRRPAQRAGVFIEDAVATSLVVETAGRPGILPLLQFTLAELFDARVDGRISEESLTDLGSLTGALGRRAEQVFGALDPDARTTARALFSRLVIPGDGEPDTRRRVRISELPAGAQPVVDAFVDARLLVTDREPTTREPTVELAHEALLERWDRLVAWVDDDRDWLVLLQHLSNAARAWESSGRAAADLYRGSRLELALEGVDSGDRGLSALEHDYLRASRDERDAVRRAEVRRSNRMRRLLAAMTAALVLALVAGVVARTQWRQADAAAQAAATSTRAARVEALVGRAERLRVTHRDEAALLAIEAFRLADTPATRSALLATFTASQGYLDSRVLPGPADQPHTGVVLPDGETSFVTDEVGRLRRYDLTTGTFGDALSPMRDGLDPIGLYSASDDGRSLAVIQAVPEHGSTTYFTVYDLTTGRPRFAPVVHRGGNAAAIALSPDGKRVYTSYFDGTVLAHDADTGARLGRAGRAPGDTSGPIGGLALVGDRLAIGGSDSVRVLDARTLRQTDDIPVPEGTTLTLFVADGETVVGNGDQGTIRVDLRTGELLWHVAGPVCLGALVAAPTDSFFCGDAAGLLHDLDLTTGVSRRTLAAQNGTVQALWLAAGGTELVAISSDRPVVSRWRIDGGDAITRTVLPGWSLMALNADGTQAVVARTPPEPVLLTDASDLRVVDLSTGQTLRKLPGIVRAGWTDGDVLVGLRLDGGRGRVVDLTLSGAGTSYTFPAGRPEDPPEYRVRPQGGLRQLDPGKSDYFAVTYLPKGNEALPMHGATVSGKPMTAADYTSTTSSPDGTRFVQGTFSGVRVYDAASGDLLKTLDPSLGVVASITRGGRLVTSNLAGEMRVFELDTLDLIRTLPGGSGYIPLVLSPTDDSFLVTMGANRELALTDLASGLPIGTPIQLAETEVKQAGLSLDGTVLAYGGGPDAPIKVVDLLPESWMAAACSLAGRNLTKEEWADTVGDLAPYRATCYQFTPSG